MISQILIIGAILLGSLNTEPKLKDLLPKELKKTEFNISKSKFQKLHPKARLVENPSFRSVYQEDINAKGITSIVYYLDDDGDQPLYEIIVNFESEAIMEMKANKLLGESNYRGKDGKSKEWKFNINENYPMHVWTFKNKIVYVLPLLKTEWNENGNIDL